MTEYLDFAKEIGYVKFDPEKHPWRIEPLESPKKNGVNGSVLSFSISSRVMAYAKKQWEQFTPAQKKEICPTCENKLKKAPDILSMKTAVLLHNSLLDNMKHDFSNEDDQTLKQNGFDPSKLTAEQKARILQPGNDPEGFYQDGELEHPEAIANWLHNLQRSKLDGPDKLRAMKMYPHLFPGLNRLVKSAIKHFEKGGSVPSSITAKLPEINRALYAALLELFNAAIYNGGTLDINEKDLSYISDSLDIVAIKYYNEAPDGDFQEELAKDGEPNLTDVEAFVELATRFENTRIDFENSKPQRGKLSITDVNLALHKAFAILIPTSKKFDNQEDEYNSLVEFFNQFANAYLTEDKKMGGKLLVKMSARKKSSHAPRKPKRNLSRDRMFVSEQEWEQNYDRKTPGKKYKKEEGGKMATGGSPSKTNESQLDRANRIVELINKLKEKHPIIDEAIINDYGRFGNFSILVYLNYKKDGANYRFLDKYGRSTKLDRGLIPAIKSIVKSVNGAHLREVISPSQQRRFGSFDGYYPNYYGLDVDIDNVYDISSNSFSVMDKNKEYETKLTLFEAGGEVSTTLYPGDAGYEDAKYIVKIHGVGDPKDHYVSNALRFTTHEAANRYGQNLSFRWTGMDDYKVEEREVETPESTMLVDVMYRDGANYKKFVENISLQNFSGEIKAGDEITMEELGYTPEQFYELAGVEYDDELDHNILEVLDVHPAGENDIIYPPQKMATGGDVLETLDAAQKLRYTDKYTGLFRQGEEVTVLFNGKKEKGVVYDHVGALVDFNANPRMFRHEYFLKLKKVPGVYRFFQDQILEAPERAANPLKIDYNSNLIEAERYREKGGVAIQDRQWVMSDWTNPPKEGRYNRFRVLHTDNGYGIFDRQTMKQVNVVKGIKGVRKSPPYATKEQAEDVTNKMNYDYYQLLDFMWNHEKGGAVNAGMVKFKDKSYPTRTLLVLGDGETEPMEIVVGTESLENALKKAKWKGKAGKVDESIYFYVPDALIVEDNQTIANNLDEPFTVVEETDVEFKTGGKMRAARPKKTQRGKIANHFFPATNFDLRISKPMAEKVLSTNDPVLKKVDIMCKELGKDGLWASVTKRDLVSGRFPSIYKTYEVWISDEDLTVPKLKEELLKLI